MTIVSIDSSTGSGVQLGSTGSMNNGVVIDQNNGIVYTINNPHTQEQQLAIIDIATGASTVIDPLGITQCRTPAIEVSHTGEVYLGGVDGGFYQVDSTTGSANMIREILTRTLH